MIPYFLLYIILVASHLISNKLFDDEAKIKKIICITGFICVFALLALRHESLGVDLDYRSPFGYLGSFDTLNSYSWKTIITLDHYLNYEKGYIIFNKIVGSIFNNRQFFMAICGLVTIAPISFLIYKNSRLALLSWVVLFALPAFFMIFTGLRQSIAIAITVCAVYFIDKRKWIPFVAMVYFASLFHYTAIVFLIAYPVYWIKLNNNTVKIILIMAIPCVYLLRNPLFSVLSQLLKEDAAIADTGGGMLFIVFICVYIFMIFWGREKDDKTNGCINLFYLACICQAFSNINQGALRVGFYFMIYLIIALPNCIYGFKENNTV